MSGRDDEWLRDRFGLEGRTGLVTGARSGIGRATALALAAAGADLVLGGRATCVGADLTDLDAVRATSARVLEQHEIDILVNNAGIIRRADARDLEWSDWRTVLDVNLDAVFTLCQALGSAMLERRHGKIINIASLLSFQGGIRVPAYTASKHAVAGLTKALANEWAPAGVNVNALAPGYVATDNTEPLRSDPAREAEIRGRIPAGRWAEATDIADAVAFLASPAADYIHGHVLVVDGGWMAR